MFLFRYITTSRTCRKERGKGIREEMGNHESGEGGGNMEHLQFSVELTVTKAKNVSLLGGW